MEYDDQLERALSETPEIESDADRLDVPEPAVREEGNVTVYENFQETVTRLDREPELVLKYLQNELGTSAHLDDRGRARLTGAFTADRLEGAIDGFESAFVRCPECGLPDTQLVAEQDTRMLKCDACGALSPTG